MSLVKLNWHPRPRELRIFGVVFAAGFVLIGAVKYYWPFERFITRDETAGLWLLAVGLVVGMIGLTGTRLALPFYWTWLGITFILGNIVSRVVMTLIYLLVFTPMRVTGSVIGRDRLQLKKPQTDTYWHNISLPENIDGYERQF